MGSQRCPMATDRTDFAAEATLRWPWPSLAGPARGAQRSAVGSGNGGAMAGTAQQISSVPDLPSSLPAVGARRQAGADLARSSRGAAGSREAESRRGFYRRLFRGGEKRGLAVGPTKRGKGTKIIALADDHSLPLAISIESASPHESRLVEGVLGHSFLDTLPQRLIGDRAYDSDRLDRDLAHDYGIEMIAPHRGVRRIPTQDGRPLRRYRRRWRVERLFAWLHNFRRLVIRWEYHAENFFGMVRLGCMQILFRYL
jgi:transposase